jgi:hypothetical protein
MATHAYIEIDKKSVESFHKRIDSIFDDIETTLFQAKSHVKIERKVKKALKDNTFGFVNSPAYSEAKRKLALKDNTNPLNLTGQMIEDLSFEMVSKVSDEYIGYLQFKDVIRTRPTLYAVLNNKSTTKQMSSKEVAAKLEKGIRFTYPNGFNRTIQYPIMEMTYNMYSKDFVRHLKKLIANSFNKQK